MDKSTIRRIHLRRLIDERFEGIAAALADRVDIAPSSISRMLYDETKPGFKRIGEATVDKIEMELQIPGWFSRPLELQAQAVPANMAVALADGDEEERPGTAKSDSLKKLDRPDWVDQSEAKAKFWGLVSSWGRQ